MLTDLKSVLDLAEAKGCAIPAFNVYNAETAMGALAAAEEADSAVILQMGSRLFSNTEAEFLAPAVVAACQRAKVRAVFHLDHGADEEAVVRALRWGCTGIMRDASTLPYEENAKILKQTADLCHAAGVTVEGELGHVGKASEEIGTDYTEAEAAARFVEETGVDALAVMVGTAHGRYRKAPVLAIDRIAEIHAATKAHLVMHGGSGVPDDQIRAAVKAGIRKFNIATDLCYTFLDTVFATSRDLVALDLFMKEPVQAVKRFCLDRIRLLGAEGSNG